MITCQISYLPISAQDSYDDVSDATDIISKFDLEVDVNDMSTTVKGELEEVLEMVKTLYQKMDEEDRQFRLQIELLSSKAYS